MSIIKQEEEEDADKLEKLANEQSDKFLTDRVDKEMGRKHKIKKNPNYMGCLFT